jgi:hypothetical protein
MNHSQRYAFEHGPLSFLALERPDGFADDAGDVAWDLAAATVAQSQGRFLAQRQEQRACPLLLTWRS